MAEESEELVIEDETDEDEVAVEYDIATYPSDFTLTGIHKMWHDGDIQIPEFQREFVWTLQQSSLLIESFLVGLPVPPVFFYIDEDNKNLVIDGQQRILSAIYYFDGYFGAESVQGQHHVFRLKGLDERSPYHNKRFADLTDSEKRKLQNCVLRAVNIRQLNPRGNNTSIYHIFERLNTGGTALKPQEIRNVVFRGEIVKTLRTLNEIKNWRMILGKKSKDKHQKDIELVLRLFALTHEWQTYEKPMKEFLNVVMKTNRDANSARIRQFSDNFPKTCNLIISELGEKPFHIRGPLNTSVLDAVFCILLENSGRGPKDISARFKRLLTDKKFLESTRTSTTDSLILRNRFNIAKRYLID